MSNSGELEQDRHIARRLKRTWPAFFERFGRLRPIQRVAIPPLLDGRDALVSAPTASGKTEAACAPLIERYLTSPERHSILYVSPTRALVNDLYVRLQGPLDRMNLRVVRRTGDHREALAGVPALILTTPESLDSMLCRQRLLPEGHALAWVSAVVLDEIHLLHGSPRGEQLRWLLERLRRLRAEAKVRGWASSEAVQVVALSATIPDLGEVKRVYLRDPVDLPPVVGGRTLRVLNEETAAKATPRAISDHLDSLAEQERPKKLLIFANQRLRVDQLTAEMRGQLEARGYVVMAHHGSLAKPERESAETQARTEERIAIFATSTLEIGIDIGDIDLVVFDEPALSVPALLQRVGRGNRRTEESVLLPCGPRPTERLVHAAMVAGATTNDLGPAERGPQHAVARQQVASYIFQAEKRARSRNGLQRLLDGCAAPIVASQLLDHMVGTGELIEDASGLRLGDLWQEASKRGGLHSCIEGTFGATVVDEVTGAQIALDIDDHAGPGIGVGGLKLEVRRREANTIEVRRAEDVERTRGKWRYAMQPWMRGAGQPYAVRRYLGLADAQWPVLRHDGRMFVFHFGGGRLRAVLELLAAQSSVSREVRINEWWLAMRTSEVAKPSWILRGTPALLELAISTQLESLERTLARPRANRELPRLVRVNEVSGWLQLERELEVVERAEWVAAPNERVRRALECIVTDP